jgi:hypothetical protein
MTAPFQPQFPTHFSSPGVVQDPGLGGALGGGLADVLASMQMQRENQFRQQELQNQMAQQQALQQYYQEQTRIQQETENRLAGEQLLERQTRGQVGGAARAALGGQPGVISPVGGQEMGAAGAPMPPPGNVFRELTEGGAQAIGGQAGYDRIFQGVEDENMTAAVKAVADARALQPQAPELPTSAQEFQFLNTLSPEQKTMYYAWKHPPSAPGTVVNVGGEPTPYSKKYDEKAAEGTIAASDQVKKTSRGLAGVDEAYRTLMGGKVLTGLFQKPSLAVHRMAAAFGVEDSKLKVADTQTMLKLTGEQTFNYLRDRDLGSGTAVSDGDREFAFTLAGRDLTQDKLSLRRTLRINFGAAVMQLDDARAQLLRDAGRYRERRPQIMSEIGDLETKRQGAWKTYVRMLVDEGVGHEEIRQRMMGSEGLNVDAIFNGLPKPNIQRLGDDIWGTKKK